jgi:ubiquinone biosynthesis protein UbiJ
MVTMIEGEAVIKQQTKRVPKKLGKNKGFTATVASLRQQTDELQQRIERLKR